MEDRHQSRKIVHGVANPRSEDGQRQAGQNCRKCNATTAPEKKLSLCSEKLLSLRMLRLFARWVCRGCRTLCRIKSNEIESDYFTESPISTADTGLSGDVTDWWKEHYPVSRVPAENTQSNHGSLLGNLKQWSLAGLHVRSLYAGQGSLHAVSCTRGNDTISCYHYVFTTLVGMFQISRNTKTKPEISRQYPLGWKKT